MKRMLFLLALCTFAFSAKEVKIGFVESQKIFKEYQATISANSQFNEYVAALKDSAYKLQTNIDKLKGELETQKLVLSEEARLKKLDDLDLLDRSYNSFLQEIFGPGGRAEQKNDELMAPLMKKINDAVSKIAQQEGFAVVLDLSEGVYYASGELNITDLVLTELNREYGLQNIPTTETKKSITVFPLQEKNNEAEAADLGQRCQNELDNALKPFGQKFNLVTANQLNTEIAKKGLGRNDIDEAKAIQIALPLLCDYIIMGTVSKSGTRIDYTISLKDVKTKQEIGQRTSSVTEEIKLTETLTNDLRNLLSLLKDQ